MYTYYPPQTPYYIDYDLKVIDGLVHFLNPNNTVQVYHLTGYNPAPVPIYGTGTVEVWYRGSLLTTFQTPEPISFFYFLPILLTCIYSKLKGV